MGQDETKYQTLDRAFLTFRCQIDDLIRDMPEGEHRTALVRCLTTFVLCEDSGEYDMYSRIPIGVTSSELDAHKLATHPRILIFRFEGEGRSVPTKILTVAQARDQIAYQRSLIKHGCGSEQDLTEAKATLGALHRRLNAMEHERALGQVLEQS